MREFTSSAEAAALLGINESYLCKLHLDGKGPSPEAIAGNRRLYSVQDLHGIQPEFDRPDGGTLHDAIQYDEPALIRSGIPKAATPGLDLTPRNLELMEFEHDTPRAPAQGNAGLLFFRVPDALTKVDGNYDVAVIDCPPQLGFLSMSALSAATRVLVTIYPEMLDVTSMSQFLRMTANLMDVITDSGADMSHDWTRYLLTRY